MTRECVECRERKDPDCFTSPHKVCKPCRARLAREDRAAMSPEERLTDSRRRMASPKEQRRYYKENREKCLDYQKTYYLKLRTKLFDGYGNKCVCCGETEPLFLELDHVHGGGAKEYKATNPANVYRRLIKENFPAGYQLLCSNCNRGRQRNGGTCPHQVESHQV